MSQLVAEGEQLLAEAAAVEARQLLELEALTRIVQALPAVVEGLSMLTSTIMGMNTRIAAMETAIMAPRVRHPVRDPDTGTITCVVDEMVRD